MKTIKINCDCCNNDITETKGKLKYRLCLFSELLDNNSCVNCSAMVYPIVEGVKHFCAFSCLNDWLHKEINK